MIVDAIVPAWNESATIAPIIETLVSSNCFRRVLVVDDGSSDDTAALARAAGAEVYVMPRNGGKGGAMLTGMSLCQGAGAIGFFDADLIGLREDHVASLVNPVVAGEAEMACGLRDYPSYNDWQTVLPIITGERFVRIDYLRLVPREFWSGFKIEAGINAAVQNHGGRTTTTVFDGVSIRSKWDKVGAQQGVRDMAKMLCDVLLAMRDAEHI